MTIEQLYHELNPKRHEAFDTTAFNSIAKGYLVIAMTNAGKSREEIREALAALSHAFDECIAKDAEQAYLNF